VVQGDTLGRLARTFGVSVQELAELNGIADPNRISVGQVLIIPGATVPAVAEAGPSATPTAPLATATEAPDPTATALPSASPTVIPTGRSTPAPAAMPTATERTTSEPPATATVLASATATATSVPTGTVLPTVRSTSTKAPTFAPTATFLPTATRTPRPSATPTSTPEPRPTLSATDGSGVNLTPEDEALATAMQAAMAPYGVQRVVIADARDQGGARVAIGTLILTKEQESGGKELSLPMGAMFAVAYRVAALMGAAEDLDSIAVVVASSEGNATALVGTRIGDVKAYVEGSLSEADFVRLWVVRDF